MRRATTMSVLGLLAACQPPHEDDHGPQRPPLPPLLLRPMLTELRTLAATLQQPDEKTRKQLREYANLALQIDEADARTAARAERALLEHEMAWSMLEPALKHDNEGVRRRAAWLCGISNRPVLQVPLLLRLKYELDPPTVIWVADALCKLGNDTGLMWLAAAFSNAETADQAGQMAIAALRDRGVDVPESPSWQTLIGLLQACRDRWRATGMSSLQNVKFPDAAQLEARLAQHLQTPEGTQLRPVDDARFVMTRLGALGVPMLARALQAEEHYLRIMPLQVLADLGPGAKGATEAIVPLLGDPLTASTAVRALGELGANDQLPHLRPLLRDVDTELRAMAAQAIGMLGDADSTPQLEARLRDDRESVDVRVRAAYGLLCLGEHEAADAYLREREANKDFHEPTLTRLRERLDSRRNAGEGR